jgi:hypothetical protein
VLFAVAFLFVLVMLVHFSMTVSRLSDQNTVLAQRLALLQERLEEEPSELSVPNGDGGEPPNAQAELQDQAEAQPTARG